MSLSINDMLTPALRKKLAAIQDKRPVLLAGGAALASTATRAFRDPSLRASEWAPLKPATLKRKKGGNVLIETSALFRSLLALPPTENSIEVGSDRKYALFHQFGTKHMPARPILPVTDEKLTDRAEQIVKEAMQAKIDFLIR